MFTTYTPTEQCLRGLQEIALDGSDYNGVDGKESAEQRTRVRHIVLPRSYILVSAMLRAEGVTISPEAEKASLSHFCIFKEYRDKAVIAVANTLKSDIVWQEGEMTLSDVACHTIAATPPHRFDELKIMMKYYVEQNPPKAQQELAAPLEVVPALQQPQLTAA